MSQGGFVKYRTVQVVNLIPKSTTTRPTDSTRATSFITDPIRSTNYNTDSTRSANYNTDPTQSFTSNPTRSTSFITDPTEPTYVTESRLRSTNTNATVGKLRSISNTDTTLRSSTGNTDTRLRSATGNTNILRSISNTVTTLRSVSGNTDTSIRSTSGNTDTSIRSNSGNTDTSIRSISGNTDTSIRSTSGNTDTSICSNSGNTDTSTIRSTSGNTDTSIRSISGNTDTSIRSISGNTDTSIRSISGNTDTSIRSNSGNTDTSTIRSASGNTDTTGNVIAEFITNTVDAEINTNTVDTNTVDANNVNECISSTIEATGYNDDTIDAANESNTNTIEATGYNDDTIEATGYSDDTIEATGYSDDTFEATGFIDNTMNSNTINDDDISTTDYKPPLSKAEKVPRIEANYRVTDGNIAAIDFGTTSVSLAYTTKGDEKVSTLILDEEEKATRVPNAVLLKREGKFITVKAFGYMARSSFTSMRQGLHQKHIYFERIKMLMKSNEKLDRQTVVESFSGEKFYLLEVIAFILKYVKDQLIDHLSRTVKQFKTTDFDWVITVPAIWDARGKRMMREAAYLAGLLTKSDDHVIKKFTPVEGRSLPLPKEINPDRLSLALEPESAALYSQLIVVEEIKKSKSTVRSPTDYLVIDIGGGTVDITAHAEVNGGINVENVPTGNDWGGTRINEAFSKMLQEIVDDPNFEKFLALGDYSQQMSVINKILYKEFEGQKVFFGRGKIDEEITVSLSGKFAKFYDKDLEAGVKEMDGVDYDEDELFIKKHVVEAKLFGPTLDGIISCTLDAIEDSGSRADTFYLVGGFGGCKYVHDMVEASIKRMKGSHCQVLVPPTPHLAVATGAAMWRKNPDKVKARRVDATYGIGVESVFDPNIHDEHYRYYLKELKQYKCSNIFKVFLQRDDLASSDELITTSLLPVSDDETKMCINIYTTLEHSVQYIVDKNGKPTVSKIGELVIDIPNPRKLPREERRVDITMDFSGTEIQAKAKYRVTGKEVKIVCDFLTAKD